MLILPIFYRAGLNKRPMDVDVATWFINILAYHCTNTLTNHYHNILLTYILVSERVPDYQ